MTEENNVVKLFPNDETTYDCVHNQFQNVFVGKKYIAVVVDGNNVFSYMSMNLPTNEEIAIMQKSLNI